jgi:type II restriction enzyme
MQSYTALQVDKWLVVLDDMALKSKKKAHVRTVLLQSLRKKFQNYSPETKHMPFHYRLLGKDRMALLSFIQSLNTTFGTSIYERVAVALAEGRFTTAQTQVKPFNEISTAAHSQIQRLMDRLATTEIEPNKASELHSIREVCKSGEMNNVKLTKVDIWLERSGTELFLIDMKTVKPNIGEFKGFKRTLLEWAAAEMARNPAVQIKTMIGIPYNPYEPKAYDRWTMKGMFDLPEEILVAEELWDFIGGSGAYQDLLDCFEQVGLELRPEIDNYFSTFR